MTIDELNDPRARTIAGDLHPGWIIGLGVLVLVSGLVAIAFPFLGTMAAQAIIAATLIVSGVTETFYAVRGGRRVPEPRVLAGAAGVLSVVAGVLLLLFPVPGLFATTVVLAAIFATSGVFRLATGWRHRKTSPGPWILVSGILALALAVLVFIGLPASALWVLGLVLGVGLVSQGISLLVVGVAARRAERRGTGPTASDGRRAPTTSDGRRAPTTSDGRGASTDRVDEASWESFPASDPPGYR